MIQVLTPFSPRVLAEPVLQGTDRTRAHRPTAGFALLTVLWLITALSAVVGLSLAATRLGQRATLNRIALTRGRWAAEACLAIVQARWVQHRLADTATIDLGRGTWCRWEIEDPTTRVNVNTAEREVLERLPGCGMRDAGCVVSIVGRRRARPLADLREIGGLDPTYLTVDGPGTINLSAASSAVLLALPGITAEAAERLLARRTMGRPIGSLDELAGLLSPGARDVLLSRYADLARIATFSASQLVVTAEGGIGEQGARSRTLRSTIEILVVPLPERLAAIRRWMW
jgi:DNA uptake protein ComE-like DNA-binding protein